MSKRTPYTFEPVSENTPLYWRSLEEKDRLHDPAMYEERTAEFTLEQREQHAVGRRGFLGVVGSAFALAGAAGCRRPVEKIIPYAKMPEEIIPGVPSHYATVYERCGDALGLVVESHEGRPTKIEGNPEHPSSMGGADLITQAVVLDLYDPDRTRTPLKSGQPATWEAFQHELEGKLTGLNASGGERLYLLIPPTASPSVARLKGALRKRFPKATIARYAPIDLTNAREGARIAFGRPVHAHYAYDKARVIVSFDSDFLQTEPGSVRATRLFARSRKLRGPRDPMSRLYVIESVLSSTGSNADHRLRVPASQVGACALAIIAELSEHHGIAVPELAGALKKFTLPAGVDPKWIAATAKDLASSRGTSVIVAGSGQPPSVHAVIHLLNVVLGNAGRTVSWLPVDDDAMGTAGNDVSIKTLAEHMAAGRVEALVMIGGNPVYDAPGELGFGDLLAKVPFSTHLACHNDETSFKCTWHLPRSHALECWGDLRSLDGTLSVQQPLIAPLYASKSDVELLALFTGVPERTGYDLVRSTWTEIAPFTLVREHAWQRVLRDGYVPNTAYRPVDGLTLRLDALVAAIGQFATLPAPTNENLEVVFTPCPKMMDGRYANNSWLQELPDPLTKICWDNAALFSHATAKELGLRGGDLVRVTANGRSITIAAWVLPGVADHVVVLPLGWGRTRAGRVGNEHGFDVYPLRTLTAPYFVGGVKIEKTGTRHTIAQTQEHNSMEGRPIAREATLEEYRKEPHFPQFQAPAPRTLPLWKEQKYEGHKWGMSIDLTMCTGCNACVVACQAENNIAVVGKEQVSKGRELHWLRIDRYFMGDDGDNAKVAYQPLACVQCEDAPCENVCPVNATVHSPEGLNDMVYNRCIGTRYCANNCPYKVRRFNYLEFRQEFWGGEVPETIKMQHNPDVTVRGRGVMEKCTYCVQRIQEAKIDSKRSQKPIKDGKITPACAQTCAAEAIVFGDLNDPNSRVAKLAKVDRRYGLLAEIGTQPRTSYLAKVRNPNSEVEG